MTIIFIATLSFYLAIYFLANYDKIRARFIHQQHRVTVCGYSNGVKFVIYSTTVQGDEQTARIVGQDLVTVMEGYEKCQLTYEITKENN